MTSKEILFSICRNDNDNHALHDPYSFNGFTYGSDGYILIRAPLMEEFAENAFPFSDLSWSDYLHAIFDAADGPWVEWPNYCRKVESEPCVLCGGSGYARVCDACDGEGLSVLGKFCGTCCGAGFFPSMKSEGVICQDCEGTGRIFKGVSPCSFGDDPEVCLNASFYKKLSILPGLQISEHVHHVDHGGVFKFRCDGAIGLIMGVQK